MDLYHDCLGTFYLSMDDRMCSIFSYAREKIGYFNGSIYDRLSEDVCSIPTLIA